MAKEARRATKKKAFKNIASGVAHVNSSFNNTKILISDVQGNAIAWSSAGTMGFKGSRKSTPYAAQMAAEDAGRKAQDHGVKTLEVEVQGPGSGRESALRALPSRIGAIGRGVGEKTCFAQTHQTEHKATPPHKKHSKKECTTSTCPPKERKSEASKAVHFVHVPVFRYKSRLWVAWGHTAGKLAWTTSVFPGASTRNRRRVPVSPQQLDFCPCNQAATCHVAIQANRLPTQHGTNHTNRKHTKIQQPTKPKTQTQSQSNEEPNPKPTTTKACGWVMFALQARQASKQKHNFGFCVASCLVFCFVFFCVWDVTVFAERLQKLP